MKYEQVKSQILKGPTLIDALKAVYIVARMAFGSDTITESVDRQGRVGHVSLFPVENTSQNAIAPGDINALGGTSTER